MTTPRLRSRRGFTLIELLVVILIIGILSAFAVPQYTKSLEVNKFDDAAAMVNMIGTTNRMYALDHGGTPVSGHITNSLCNGSTTCPDVSNPQCSLISCKYLASTDWDGKPYDFYAGNAGSCGGTPMGSAMRKTSGANSTSKPPYNSWGVCIDNNGVFSTLGTSPPTPTQ